MENQRNLNLNYNNLPMKLNIYRKIYKYNYLGYMLYCYMTTHHALLRIHF